MSKAAFPPAVSEAFQRYVRSRKASWLQHEVSRLTASHQLSRESIDAALRSGAPSDSHLVTSELLDLTLYYVRQCLADHDLTEEELLTLRQLKRLFRIAEGDFSKYAREEVAELLATQLERALADRQIDNQEALQKVRLQEALGLGYDEFLELTRPLFDEVVAQLWEEGVRQGWHIGDLEQRIAAMRTVYNVQTHLDRLAAPVYQAITEAEAAMETQLQGTARSRHIPQEVKDQVWRRDQSRCVECGSQERLEFDHIIPFARGGANTYRNIQLLCEPCNRAKSAAIG